VVYREEMSELLQYQLVTPCYDTARSGRERQARATLGNRQYPPLDPAPGRYEFE
jgi:hypothetical protein